MLDGEDREAFKRWLRRLNTAGKDQREEEPNKTTFTSLMEIQFYTLGPQQPALPRYVLQRGRGSRKQDISVE